MGPAFAHPQRVAGTNPGAGLLKAVTRLMQDLSNRAGSQVRQPLFAQGPFQHFQ